MTAAESNPEDLTARARIRDAAMRLFGEVGFERATVRGIAEAAGVSPGLVRHHFGSKQGLREACDEHLLRMVRRLDDRARESMDSGVPGVVLSARAAAWPHMRYLTRSLSEGFAAELFDELARLSEPWLAEADRNRSDPSAVDTGVRAAVVTAWALSSAILHEHLSRAFGVDMFSPEGDRLLARAHIDLYSHPMLSLDDARRILDALDEAESSPPQGESR